MKLLAIEEEQEGRGKVIVMELCTGGSLFNILDDPENTYGLQENEFLLVVEHLSAGMYINNYSRNCFILMSIAICFDNFNYWT